MNLRGGAQNFQTRGCLPPPGGGTLTVGNFSLPVNIYFEMPMYTRKNLTTCSKSANKPSTSLEQAVNNL